MSGCRCRVWAQSRSIMLLILASTLATGHNNWEVYPDVSNIGEWGQPGEVSGDGIVSLGSHVSLESCIQSVSEKVEAVSFVWFNTSFPIEGWRGWCFGRSTDHWELRPEPFAFSGKYYLGDGESNTASMVPTPEVDPNEMVVVQNFSWGSVNVILPRADGIFRGSDKSASFQLQLLNVSVPKVVYSLWHHKQRLFADEASGDEFPWAVRSFDLSVKLFEGWHDLRWEFLTSEASPSALIFRVGIVGADAPRVFVEFPPASFEFRRGMGAFLRVRVGEESRISSPNHWRSFWYKLIVLVNGVRHVEHPNPFFVGLGLSDGQYDVQIFAENILGEVMDGAHESLRVSVNNSAEYEEDESVAVEAPWDVSDGAVCAGILEKEPCDGHCSGHGRCDSGTCVCDVHWMGPMCNSSILSDAEYLPPSEVGRWRCLERAWFDEGAVELQRQLHAVQFPSSCTASGSKPMVYWTNDTAGLGHTLREMAFAVGKGVGSGRPVVVAGRWVYFVHRACARDQYTCYLHPIDGCLGTMEPHRLEPLLIDRRDVSIPDAWAHKGLFWWRSSLLQYVLTTNNVMQALVRRTASRLGMRGATIGVHIRRGDSCIKFRDAVRNSPDPETAQRALCKPTHVYVERVRQLSARYGIEDVYLSTDDEGVASEMQQTAGLRVLRLPFNRTILHSDWSIEHRLTMGLLDRKTVLESALLDILLLAQCDAFVVGFSGAFSRLAYELSAAQKGYYPPFISMDWSWYNGGLN